MFASFISDGFVQIPPETLFEIRICGLFPRLLSEKITYFENCPIIISKAINKL